MLGSTHNDECEIDGCGITEELMHCGGCNISFHPQCMTIHWGLDIRRMPAPWCHDCFDEWEEANGMDVLTSSSRTATTVGYDPAHRSSGPALGACPVASSIRGRQRVRFTRFGPEAATNVAFMPCVRGRTCPHECNRVVVSERQIIRDEYDKLRRNVKTGFVTLTQTVTLTLTLTLTLTDRCEEECNGFCPFLPTKCRAKSTSP